MARSVMSSKGQVVVPRQLRDRLGLRAGAVLDWTERDGAIEVRVVTAEPSRNALIAQARALAPPLAVDWGVPLGQEIIEDGWVAPDTDDPVVFLQAWNAHAAREAGR